jgi:hypothetical protein
MVEGSSAVEEEEECGGASGGRDDACSPSAGLAAPPLAAEAVAAEPGGGSSGGATPSVCSSLTAMSMAAAGAGAGDDASSIGYVLRGRASSLCDAVGQKKQKDSTSVRSRGSSTRRCECRWRRSAKANALVRCGPSRRQKLTTTSEHHGSHARRCGQGWLLCSKDGCVKRGENAFIDYYWSKLLIYCDRTRRRQRGLVVVFSIDPPSPPSVGGRFSLFDARFECNDSQAKQKSVKPAFQLRILFSFLFFLLFKAIYPPYQLFPTLHRPLLS